MIQLSTAFFTDVRKIISEVKKVIANAYRRKWQFLKIIIVKEKRMNGKSHLKEAQQQNFEQKWVP